MAATPLPERKSWQALKRHQQEIAGLHLRDLFASDPGRGERLTAEAAGLYLDYSKNRVTDETMRLLVALAEESSVPDKRDAMFRGEHINVSEDRPVLHVALRMPGRASRCWWTAPTSWRRCTRCSAGWRTSPTGSGRATGRATPASRSGTSSTSASADPTSAR